MLKIGNLGGGTRFNTGLPGVFINEGTITHAKLEYNTSFLPDMQYKDDIALRFTLSVPGLSFSKDLYIGGSFKREGDPSGAVVGWGTAYRIALVFEALGVDGDINDEGRLEDPEVLDQFIGKDLLYLQYVNRIREKDGIVKPGYTDYRRVVAYRDKDGTADHEALLGHFKQDHNNGYIRNYKPELIESTQNQSDGTDFNFGANANDEEEKTEKDTAW